MASANKNTNAPAIVNLGRGIPVKLGTIGAAGDTVVFSVPEPTRESNGFLIIQVGPGVTLGAGTFALEVSLDAGASWFTFATSTTTSSVIVFGLTGQPGGDAAAIFAAQYNIGGMGSGAQFRFGFVTAPTSGSSPVWALSA
jgi:hypothetical protein